MERQVFTYIVKTCFDKNHITCNLVKLLLQISRVAGYQPCYELRRRKLLLIYVWKIENQVKKAKALESLDSVTILFFGSSAPFQARSENKKKTLI